MVRSIANNDRKSLSSVWNSEKIVTYVGTIEPNKLLRNIEFFSHLCYLIESIYKPQGATDDAHVRKK